MPTDASPPAVVKRTSSSAPAASAVVYERTRTSPGPLAGPVINVYSPPIAGPFVISGEPVYTGVGPASRAPAASKVWSSVTQVVEVTPPHAYGRFVCPVTNRSVIHTGSW